jgi:SAM-dependent methyltransferase
MHRKITDASASSGYILDTPYPETFFRELSPAWLNYVAALGGSPARELDEPFDYLELGCGLGNSLLTYAGAFPNGCFHGCDFNVAHLEHARTRASEFGIRNVELHGCRFQELQHEELPLFDFIAAHGVYSWVGAPERRAIRQLVRDHLKPGGLLYVSYNSQPGWSAEMPLRKLLVELAAIGSSDSTVRTELALRSLQQLGRQRLRFLEANPACAAAIGAYGRAPVSYLAHEFLNAAWEPFYCVDVADQMQEADLTYLGSATLVDNHPLLVIDAPTWTSIGNLATERQRRLALDFATNQQFRRDVFVRAASRGAEDGSSALDSVTVGCADDPHQLRTQVRVPRGVIHFREAFIRRLQELVEAGAVTIGAAVTKLASNATEAAESRRNLLYLVAAGALMPFAKTPAAAARERGPANEIVARILQYSVDHRVECTLPSEALGSGVRINPSGSAAVLAWMRGSGARRSGDLIERLLRLGVVDP